MAFSRYYVDGTPKKTKRHNLNIKHPKVNESHTMICSGNKKSGICKKIQITPTKTEALSLYDPILPDVPQNTRQDPPPRTDKVKY